MFIFENFLLENSNSDNTNKYETELRELDQIAEEALTLENDDEMKPTSESAALIIAEASLSLQKLYTALLESDLVLEAYKKQGREDEAEIMLEGVVDNFFGKLRKIFEDVWATITKFFNSVRLKMREMLDFGSKWLAKNESSVLANESKYKTMEFKGFKYDIVELKSDNSTRLNAVQTASDTLIKKSESFIKSMKSQDMGDIEKFKEKSKEYDDESSVEKILAGTLKGKLSGIPNDVKDIATLKKVYRKIIRGGDEKADKFKGSEGPDLKQMMSFIKDKNSLLGNVEKIYGMFKKNMGSALKMIKEAESQAKKLLNEKDKGIVGRVQQICSKAASGVKAYLGIGTGIYAVRTEEMMAAGRQFLSMLKKVASGKNTDPDEEGSSDSDKKEETKTVPDTNSLLNYLYENSAF